MNDTQHFKRESLRIFEEHNSFFNRKVTTFIPQQAHPTYWNALDAQQLIYTHFFIYSNKVQQQKKRSKN
jgi:hypothetical protein